MRSEQDTHKNYNTLIGQGITSSAGKALTSVKLVLPFLYASAGAPIVFAGMLVPISTVAKRAVQLLFAPLVKASSSRKRLMALAAILIASLITTINLTLNIAPPLWLAPIFLLAALLIGAGNGLSSLAFQDLIGCIFTRENRSRLLLAQSCFSGVIVVILAVGAQLLFQPGSSLAAHQELIWLGVCLYLLSALFSMAVKEPSSNTLQSDSENDNVLGVESLESKHNFQKAFAIPWFGKFLIARTLYLSVELAIPFFSIHAASFHGNSISGLNAFVIAVNLGLVAGYVIWMKVGENALERMMILAAGITAIGGLLAMAIELGYASQGIFLYAVVFVLVSIGTQGIKNGRILYLINHTTDEERPYCIAIANGIVGVFGIILGALLGLLASFKGVAWPIFVLFLLNIAAAAYTFKMGCQTRSS